MHHHQGTGAKIILLWLLSGDFNIKFMLKMEIIKKYFGTNPHLKLISLGRTHYIYIVVTLTIYHPHSQRAPDGSTGGSRQIDVTNRAAATA